MEVRVTPCSQLFKATYHADIDHSPFIHATDCCLVDTTLHDNPDLVIDWVQIWDIWMPQVRRNDVWCLLVQKVNGFTCMMRCVHLQQQHNLGDVANSILYLCTETS